MDSILYISIKSFKLSYSNPIKNLIDIIQPGVFQRVPGPPKLFLTEKLYQNRGFGPGIVDIFIYLFNEMI